MYNAKPHYNKFTSEFNLPENYSGNAFSEPREIESAPPVESQEVPKEEVVAEVKDEKKSVPTLATKKKGGFGIDLSRLFGGGIGTEELLILGLILLLRDNEESDDIILLLVFLLLLG